MIALLEVSVFILALAAGWAVIGRRLDALARRWFE